MTDSIVVNGKKYDVDKLKPEAQELLLRRIELAERLKNCERDARELNALVGTYDLSIREIIEAEEVELTQVK